MKTHQTEMRGAGLAPLNGVVALDLTQMSK